MRPASAFGLRERGCDALVCPYFTKLTLIAVLILGDSLAHHLDTLRASHRASAGRNQKRPSVRLVHAGFRGTRPAGEASTLFPVSPLEQDIQKKVASKNANREKDGSRHIKLTLRGWGWAFRTRCTLRGEGPESPEVFVRNLLK